MKWLLPHSTHLNLNGVALLILKKKQKKWVKFCQCLTIIRFYDRIERSNKPKRRRKENRENNSRWSSIFSHSCVLCQQRTKKEVEKLTRRKTRKIHCQVEKFFSSVALTHSTNFHFHFEILFWLEKSHSTWKTHSIHDFISYRNLCQHEKCPKVCWEWIFKQFRWGVSVSCSSKDKVLKTRACERWVARKKLLPSVINNEFCISEDEEEKDWRFGIARCGNDFTCVIYEIIPFWTWKFNFLQVKMMFFKVLENENNFFLN